jgi:ketosteroid isomerase-like protein
MTSSLPTTIDEAEAAWLDATTATTTDAMRALLHPDFIVVHGPVGYIQNVDEFLAGANKQLGATRSVTVIDPTIRTIGDAVTVSCLQEAHIAFVPDLHPFVIQAAVSRLWVRTDGHWLLAHLHMARRFPPG